MQSWNITPKILTQRRKLSTNLQDTHGVQYAHSMIQKTDATFIGEGMYWKVLQRFKSAQIGNN